VPQAPVLDVLGDEFGQPRLVDRHHARFEQRDLRGVGIDAHDVVAEVGETSAGDEAYVARPDHGYASH
jgi:hypothetical protein